MDFVDRALISGPRPYVLMEGQAVAGRIAQALRQEEAQPRSRGLLSRLFGARGEHPKDGDEDRPREKALRIVSWAPNAEYADGYALIDGVAVIDVSGILTPRGYYDWWDDRWCGGYEGIGAAVQQADADGRARGLMLCVNSPGGLVDDLFELVAALRARSGTKPMWAHASQACSAAYAIASTADRVLASGSALVGSIGVVMLHVDQTEALAKWGIKVTPIESGPWKTEGASFKPLAEDARTKLQSDVDHSAGLFFDAVAAGRGLDVAAVAAMGGRYFLADHSDPALSGLALRLVDEIASEQAAHAAFVKHLSAASGAPAGGGTAPGATAPGSRKEASMATLAETIAKLEAKAAKGDAEAKKRLALLKAAAEGEDEKPEGEAEEGDEEEKPEGEAAEGDEEEDPEKEPATARAQKGKKTAQTGPTAGFAVLDLPDAKGREALARSLAKKVAAGSLTLADAKDLLATAPKGNRFGDTMAGRDINPGSSGGGDRKSALSAAVDRLVDKRKPG